ncbi:unnamed protein product [Enterobius vermicularis]|uniref:Moesin/ezrin/radixin homolog 1 n=1 Tax=Enterobius vermicularis TaxID=51028 RepID=A0A0N4V4W5_ENTVE|nr:unnamed protein product [Enterobius vermicularis]
MGVFPWSSSSRSKRMWAKVSTMDADLDKIGVEADCTGRQLFDTVCRIIGLREIWYFGLQFKNKKNFPCWLQMEKKISKQDVRKEPDGSIHFLFLVKFYPEDVEEELIQDITRHLFFLQIKQSILSMHLYCPAEASVLLASYAVQALRGDVDEDSSLELSELLPQSVTTQYEMTPQMWTDRVRRWWENNKGLSREDAEMEYLRVAQDLEMYGIQYYPICFFVLNNFSSQNSKESDLHLGVSAQGIGIYKSNNRITPRPFFSWNEIKNISFKNRVFYMRTTDKSTIKFRAQDMSINMSILDLCIGTHNLYLRRRQPDLLEVQQMKVQAQEQRIRRMHEQNRFAREKEKRLQAETERDQLKKEIEAINKKLDAMKENVKRAEDTAQAFAQKARISSSEAIALMKRSNNAEAECERLKTSLVDVYKMKISLEQKVRDAERVTRRLIQMYGMDCRSQDPLIYSSCLYNSPNSAQICQPPYIYSDLPSYSDRNHHDVRSSSSSDEGTYGQSPDDEPVNFSSYSNLELPLSAPFYNPIFNPNNPPPDPSVDGLISNDVIALRNEIDTTNAEFNERKKRLKEKMSEFRAEIESLKVEERQSEHDRIHAANVNMGIDKYSTLRKVFSAFDCLMRFFFLNFYIV